MSAGDWVVLFELEFFLHRLPVPGSVIGMTFAEALLVSDRDELY